MAGQNAEIEEKSTLFADNLRRVVGGSYILADSLYGVRSYVLAKGYEKEMEHYAEDSTEFKAFKKKRDGEMAEVKGMGLWAAGGTVMALFGNRTAKKEMQALSKKLASFLQDEGVDIQGNALAKALEEKDKSILDKAFDFAYRYPSEIMHACFAVGSLGIVKNGWGDGSKDNRDLMTLSQGLSVLIGALIGVFVPEKTPEQIAKLPPAKNSFEQAGRFLQQYANKLTSGFYLANNGFSAIRAVNDKKKFNKEEWMKTHKAEQSKAFHDVWKIRGAGLATYVFGAGVLSMTKKTSGSGKKGELAQSQIFEEAAEMLASMPEELRDTYIRKTASFLSQHRELGMAQLDIPQIAEKITAALHERQQIAGNAVSDNSWKVRSSNVPSGAGKGV